MTLPELSDPRRSRVVLIGADTYDNFPALPAVARNLVGLTEVLTDPQRWGLPRDAYQVVHDPDTPARVNAAIRTAASQVDVAGMLLIYFAGHGVIDADTGELHLAVRGTDRDAAYSTAVPYEWIRRTVQHSRADRRVVILDCCYSGRAIAGMGTGADSLADRAEIDQSCVLVAASANRLALAPVDEPYTAFTGVLLSLLRDGVPGGPDPLDLATVHEEITRVQRARGRPVPELRARNRGERIPLVRNAARAACPTVPRPREHHPEPSYVGRLLRGHPRAADPELAGQTVAILAHSAADGALGVRLDRPTDRSPADVLGEQTAATLDVPAVLDGGPVRDVVLILAALRTGVPVREPWRQVVTGIVLVPRDSDMARTRHAFTSVCLFVGYLGWRPQQLEDEIQRGELVPQAAGLADWLADAEHVR